jgi:hypothetical protein
MARLNKQNIDRKTNKPNPKRTEGRGNDEKLQRSSQIRQDDDIFRTPRRTVYDIDYAIKWYIDNEIQPQITHQKQLINVPVIFANGEKWDNVQRLGYIRDEKGMLQSPLIMIKRNVVTERDSMKNLDVNRTQPGSKIIYRNRYNARNRYEDRLFPIPDKVPAESQEYYLLDIPKWITIEYDLLMWCDFTTQMNDLVDQLMPYSRFAWGNETNRFPATIGAINFETVNTVGEDRLVRATVPLSVDGTLLSGQEARKSTLQKMYSPKKLKFDTIIDVSSGLFETTQVPISILRVSQQIFSGGTIQVSSGGTITTIDDDAMAYLVNLRDEPATYVSDTTVTVAVEPAINPVTNSYATKNEFDLYINGQYIDKVLYTWTPGAGTQTIVFDTGALGYIIEATDAVIINGRWA